MHLASRSPLEIFRNSIECCWQLGWSGRPDGSKQDFSQSPPPAPIVCPLVRSLRRPRHANTLIKSVAIVCGRAGGCDGLFAPNFSPPIRRKLQLFVLGRIDVGMRKPSE